MTRAMVGRIETYAGPCHRNGGGRVNGGRAHKGHNSASMRIRLRWDRIVAVAVVFVLAACIVALGVTVRDLRHQVDVLNRACGPVYTGGGVTQCAQPTVKP